MDRILVTGGAGFVGSHLVDALVERGYKVRIFDNLEPQVHGQGRSLPSYLNKEAEFIEGDIRDRDALKKAQKDVEVVFHHAAAVGVGQSMYEVRKYMEVNTLGAANLLDILVNEKNSVKKMIVASSMSIYGEGEYNCSQCGKVYPKLRSPKQLQQRDWEMKCPNCSEYLEPIPTSEGKPLHPNSIYAISKRDHEEMFLCVGRAYGIPTVALRYFNIYGTRQALSNPYTGVVAIFSSRLLNRKPPLVYEDGLQSRDFVHVSDIVQANLLAMEKDEANFEVFNVGTGNPTTVLDVAHSIAKGLNVDIEPQLINKFREGDIRHCFADVTKINKLLGFQSQVSFEYGISALVEWLISQTPQDSLEYAQRELINRQLIK